MLKLYFFFFFYKNFLLFFVGLAFVFALSDLFVRFPLIASLKTTPKLFLLMFPLMAQFAIPLASCLSVQIVIGNLYIEDEISLIYFFSSARAALRNAVLIFSLSIVAIYFLLVCFWVPQSYKKGKKFILDFAKEQFYQLEPNRFYSITPELSLYFKNRFFSQDKVFFEKLLMEFKEKKGNRYLSISQRGYLYKNKLFLQDGIIQNIDSDKRYYSNFKETEIDLDALFDKSKGDQKLEHPKFLTITKLKRLKEGNDSFAIEYYKRIAQVFWQLLFPFLGLWGIMVFGRKKSNLLLSVGLSGAIFLFSYISLNLSQCVAINNLLLIFYLYIPLILISFFFYFLYYKKR